MSPLTNRPSRGSRRLRPETLLKRAALVLGLLVIALTVFATKFTSLDVNGADYGQIARNLAGGHGYTTSVLSPLSLSVAPRTENHPELTRPPAYVTVLALAILIAGASDRTIAVVSLLFFVLSVLALYFVARRCFGPRVALWASLLYALSVPLLRQAISGLDTTFLCFLVTLLFGVLLWGYRAPGSQAEGEEVEEGPSSYPVAVPLVAGALAALCYLTSYDMLVLLPMALYFLWRADRPQFRRNLLLTLGAFLVLVLPWVIRGTMIAGRPFISLHSYELAMFTDAYPTQTLFRRFADVPSWPWAVWFTNAPDMAKKLAQGLGTLYTDLAQFAGPYLMPFLLVGLLLSAPRRAWTLLHGSLVLVLILQVLVLCLYQPLARLLLPYAPLAAALAAYWFVTLVAEWNLALLNQQHGRRRRRRSQEWLAYLALTIAGVIPLALFMFLGGPSRPHPAIDTMRALGGMPQQYLATDLPWLAAWYGEKQAMTLPFRDKDWEALEQAKLAPAAIYLSPALLESPPTEAMETLQRLLLTGQPYRGMERVTDWRQAGLLLAKPAAGPPSSSSRPAPRPGAASSAPASP